MIAYAPKVPQVPEVVLEALKTVKIEVLAALTREVTGWRLPGLCGVEIWVDEVNAAGGLQIGDDRYLVEVIVYGDEYISTKAVLGAKKLVLEDEAAMMLCAPPATAVQHFLTEHEIIATTDVTNDIGLEYPYLVNLSESFPLNMLAVYDYVARANPWAKTVATCNPEDKSSVMAAANTQATWEMSGVKIVYDVFFDPETIDYTPIATAMLATDADIMCWDAAYPGGTNLLTEEAYFQGFEGLITSVTLALYKELIEKVGKEYIEGYTFAYPDFGDPMLTPEQNAFYAKYEELYPGMWGACPGFGRTA